MDFAGIVKALSEGGQKRRQWVNEKGAQASEALNYYLGPTGIPQRAEVLGDVLNPVNDMERAGTAARGMVAPGQTPMQRLEYAGDMLSNTAGVAAPMVAGGYLAKNADDAAMFLEDALTGFSARPGAVAARDFATDEAGAVRAFHGSPHSFDRFSMDAIGTGEGAQAYGHGLYFAEAEDTAKAYRDALQFPRIDGAVTPVEKVADDLNYHRGNVDAVRNSYNSMLERGTPEAQAMAKEKLAALPEALQRFKGSMYEVNIDANPEDFLDWDAPLSSQPEKVRKGVLSVNAGSDPLLRELLDTSPEGMMLQGMMPNAKGSAAYRTLMERGFEDGATGLNLPAGNPIKPADKWATERLRAQGIPGIRYLDAGSRGAGDGSRNYVVFDENLISIVRKYGIAGAATVLGVSAADVQSAMAQGDTMGQALNVPLPDQTALRDYLKQ